MSVTFKMKMYDADAEKCYQELQSIGAEYTPQQVVDFARNENTELHKCFTWNDSEAAEKWRKQEARLLIANIVYVKDEETKEPSCIRAIHYTDESNTYKPITLIVQNKTEYENLLERAKADLEAFERKYQALGNLQEIINLIY